jgi:hypothetical protein
MSHWAAAILFSLMVVAAIWFMPSCKGYEAVNIGGMKVGDRCLR